MPLDFDSDVDFVDQNIRYMDELYALQPGRFDNWRDWCANNLETSLNAYTIPAGKTVMAGTWNGDVYGNLKTYSGAENCVGFDIVNYYDDPHNSIVYGDFRDIHTDNPHSVAIFYNGLGTWEHNTTSKRAGLDYAVANLVTGGLYLEPYTNAACPSIDANSSLQFQEVAGTALIIYKKI